MVGNQTPGITKVSPPNAAVGTTVTITGQGFVAGNTTVRFGGSPSGHVAVASGTQLTASVPAHGITTVDITVRTAGGTTAVTSADQFTYRPLNAMAVDPATSGYWLTTPNGNVYEFNAPWYGSKAGTTLPAPIIGIAAAPSGGYWLVTSKGNVYNYNAPWYGSKAGTTLPAPIIGIAAAPSGGYWLVTSKGNVYNYNAPWYGSTAGTTLTAPVTTIVSSNAGYLLATQSGDVFNYNAPYYGSPADRG